MSIDLDWRFGTHIHSALHAHPIINLYKLQKTKRSKIKCNETKNPTPIFILYWIASDDQTDDFRKFFINFEMFLWSFLRSVYMFFFLFFSKRNLTRKTILIMIHTNIYVPRTLFYYIKTSRNHLSMSFLLKMIATEYNKLKIQGYSGLLSLVLCT